MGNHVSHLLKQWEPYKDQGDWVLGTVYKTEGPSYRKAGAMMLFSSMGRQFGLLSGGCLESDIQQHAKRVMHSGQALTLCYDGSDEDDLSFQLGIGCGGTVHILLQPVTPANEFLQLHKVLSSLNQRQSGIYYQQIPDNSLEGENRFDVLQTNEPHTLNGSATIITHDSKSWLATTIRPQPHLLIAGGGIDAQPLVNLAHELGWHISLWDPRPANARREFFLQADAIIRGRAEDLQPYILEYNVDAAILMSHNLALDAAALRATRKTPLSYLALLGPNSRLQKVMQMAELSEADFNIPIAGPAGLDIGAELPEAIALSILAECHARLTNSAAKPLSESTDRLRFNTSAVNKPRQAMYLDYICTLSR